ncbi:MAG: LD-carboxypeptidase [Labilithrix sp.]|nr:LD-carboxypeptidase [Labilithrix sp.]MCW5813839.1 LD-carboxypeptidase [Labilithrix sp.]
MNPPPPLRPGSLIAIAAPASPFDRNELFRGLAWLRTRYRLRIDGRVLARDGYLAGDDDTRAAVLSAAMLDPDVGAIVAARGGYGIMRIVDRLPWRDFSARPKHLAGFSDVTALHVVACSRGVPTVHAPNVTGLGRSISAAERLSLISAFEAGPPPEWRDLRAIVPGDATGPVFGGNLALLEAMAASGLLDVPKGAILVLEDVTERPYRIDRMLTALLLGGHLARASAIVFGGFTQCDPGPDGVTVEHVLRDRTKKLGVPIYADAPFGHGSPNFAFPLGRVARLENGVLRF